MKLAIIGTTLSWICLFLFEVLKVRAKKAGTSEKNPFFAIGTVLLIGSWLYVLATNFNQDEILGISWVLRAIVGGVLTLAFIGLYIKAIFASFPKGTLDSNGKNQAVSSGLYSICRHPGFYIFWAVAICSTICIGSKNALIIGVANAVINTIYIVIQDIYFFPSYIEGYDEYKKSVKFFGF